MQRSLQMPLNQTVNALRPLGSSSLSALAFVGYINLKLFKIAPPPPNYSPSDRHPKQASVCLTSVYSMYVFTNISGY